MGGHDAPCRWHAFAQESRPPPPPKLRINKPMKVRTKVPRRGPPSPPKPKPSKSRPNVLKNAPDSELPGPKPKPEEQTQSVVQRLAYLGSHYQLVAFVFQLPRSETARRRSQHSRSGRQQASSCPFWATLHARRLEFVWVPSHHGSPHAFPSF